MTETDKINRLITANAPLPLEKIIALEVREFLDSPAYKTMLAAREYYRNNNAINKKQRYSIQNGIREVDFNVENNCISHPFLRQLTDQKVQYLLSNDWSVDSSQAAEIFTDSFRSKLQSAARDAVLYGIGWLFVTLENNEFTFKRYPSYEIIPLWADNERERLDSIIRIYSVITYVAEQRKVVDYAEYWTLDGVSTYQKEGNRYILISTSAHLTTDGMGYNWERIPFVPIRYNDDEMSLLTAIKPIIDEYDKTVSVTADLISDMTNKLLIGTGIGSDVDVSEFAINKKLYRTAFLPDGADLKEIGTDPDITASIAHQNQLRANIYEFGKGVDYNANIGMNASGEARKYLYANLDLDCNQLEAGVINALWQIVQFLNRNPAKSYNIPDNMKIEFSRNMMINTTEIIDNAATVQGITGVSIETIVGMLPFIENPANEIAKWRAEQTQDIVEQQSVASTIESTRWGGTDVDAE